MLLAALYLLCGWDVLFVLALPVAVHELGHLAALNAFGGKVRGLRMDLTGLKISCTGGMSAFGSFSIALAGPAAGMIFAFLSAWAGGHFSQPLLTRCAGVSAVLSIFNMLPALPLDGGRMLAAALERRHDGGAKFMDITGTITGGALMAAGIIFMWLGRGMALEMAAVWLLLSQPGIVKRPGVL